MIHIGGDKFIFKKNIIGIFRCDGKMPVEPDEKEYVSLPPYKSCVIAADGDDGKCKAYFTSFTVRTLGSRLR